MNYFAHIIVYLSIYALAWAATEAKISEEIREWLLEKETNNIIFIKIKQLLTCILCASMWCGLLLWYLFQISNPDLIIFQTNITSIILLALSSVTIAMIIERLLIIEEEM